MEQAQIEKRLLMTFRLLQAAIKQREVDERIELTRQWLQ